MPIVTLQIQTEVGSLCNDALQAMRVAYDHQIFSLQKYGGVSRYFFEVAKRIHDFDGFNVSILSPIFVNNFLKNDDVMQVWGKYAGKLPIPDRVVLMLNAGLVSWKLNREPPDIVHETYYLERKLASSRTKTVVTVYDMIHEKFPQFFGVRDKSSQFKKAAVHRADHIICISENTRADLIEILGVERERTSVTHLGYSAIQRSESQAQRFTDRPYIAYVGARDRYKNFAGLIRAFGVSEFLRSNFSIVCFGGGPFTSAEREEMTRADFRTDQVIYAKGGDEVLGTVYRDAAAFVYPSLYEGFGLPPLEAMSAKCPVVCSKTSSLPEVCGDAVEYFDPYQPESIAISIERAVASPSRRQELITLGLQQIEKFSWDTCAKQTAAIYASVA